MYSLHLKCGPEEVDQTCFDLWESGTVGIREEDCGEQVQLIAGFDDAADRGELAARFHSFGAVWEREEDTDWVAFTQEAWPARKVGERIFLAPPWNTGLTPAGRVRVVHNPGQASGTGEHPCTQLALASLEQCHVAGRVVVDVGTGSGILAVAALRLGARLAVAMDTDWPSLATAQENHALNQFRAMVVAGSAECIAAGAADVAVANISGTVLLSIAEELLRIVRAGGWLILTGFPESELRVLQQIFGAGAVTGINEWRCLTLGV